MRGRLPLFVLLASALTFLASLFLPWRETQAPDSSGVPGLARPILGQRPRSIDGWVTGTGDVAVLLVVAIVLATIAALRRPHLAASCLSGASLSRSTYFAVALAMEIAHLQPASSSRSPDIRRSFHASWAYGFYLGLASAGIALLSGLAYRRSDFLRPRDPADVVACVLGIALLISFLLPWVALRRTASVGSISGIQGPAIAIAALGLMLGAVRLLGERGRPWRLPLAIATAVLTGGGRQRTRNRRFTRGIGTWIGIGCADLARCARGCARVALAARRPSHAGRRLSRMGAAALLIVRSLPALVGDQQSEPFGTASSGWYLSAGAATGALCLLLLATPALRKYRELRSRRGRRDRHLRLGARDLRSVGPVRLPDRLRSVRRRRRGRNPPRQRARPAFRTGRLERQSSARAGRASRTSSRSLRRRRRRARPGS